MKIILAYSGGLDTSYCIKYLTAKKNNEVHAVTINTGGFSETEIQEIKERALQLGATSFHCIDALDEYYQNCIKYLIFGNVLRNNTYPLSVSAERTFQAMEIIKYANLNNANAIAHGSTGAGNDQVRFDLIFEVLGGDNLKIITPIRDQQLSRQAEIDFLQKHGVEWTWEKAQYSINKGLWGTSVGGSETLTSHLALPESAWPSPLQSDEAMTISLGFAKGELKNINEHDFENPVDAISHLQKLAAPYAIGRDTHVGDTVIGIKGRVGFEAAAPLIILKSHHLLEKHTLTKWQQYWKEQLSNWYGMLLHEGQFIEPVMRNIESFLEDTQEAVSGKVDVKLLPYRFEIQGIESPNDLMQAKFGQYGEMNNAWSGEDVKGFTKILSNHLKIHNSVHHE